MLKYDYLKNKYKNTIFFLLFLLFYTKLIFLKDECTFFTQFIFSKDEFTFFFLFTLNCLSIKLFHFYTQFVFLKGEFALKLKTLNSCFQKRILPKIEKCHNFIIIFYVTDFYSIVGRKGEKSVVIL